MNIERREDTRGVPYYWLGFQRQTEKVTGMQSDVGALREGMISMSPVRIERDIASSWQVDTTAMASTLGIDVTQAGRKPLGEDVSIDH